MIYTENSVGFISINPTNLTNKQFLSNNNKVNISIIKNFNKTKLSIDYETNRYKINKNFIETLSNIYDNDYRIIYIRPFY